MIFVEGCSKWSSLQHSFVLAKGSKKSRLEETDSARGETRRKIGEKSKGRIHTEETKKKISESNIGRHNTDIAKQKISLGNSGKKNCQSEHEESTAKTW